ncbi:MAG: hypothetical protein ACI8Q1_000401 [Parvicella sp.]|jgi:hypothetical protein
MHSMRIFSLFILLLFLSPKAKAQDAFEWTTYFTAAEIALCNTAEEATYLTQAEKDCFALLNLARKSPDNFNLMYIDYLQSEDEIGNKKYKARNKYYYSLSKDLKKLKASKFELIKPDEELFEAAKCWAIESGKKGVIGHNRRKCKKGQFAECCNYMDEEGAIHHIFSLLIDEGISDLGHRKIMLTPEYSKAGASIQYHKTYGKCLVIDIT